MSKRNGGASKLDYSKLDVKAKKSWFISRFIALIIFSALSITIRFIAHNKLGDKGWIASIIIALIILLLILNTFVYPTIEYKQWQYTITEDKIELIHGIYFIKTTLIPIVRIQHIKTSQGPINRKLGLSNIEIHTAGGMHEIPNITKEKAEELSQYLKDKVHQKVSKNLEAEENNKED